jgi:uncharacterized membrane protein
MNPWWMAYGAALLAVVLLDGAWLGFIARDLYAREMGELMASEVRKLPAALFYLGYPAGLVALALHPRPAELADAALRGALVGLVAYGTYDLTNRAVVRGFSMKLALVDLAWGTFVSAAAATAAAWVLMKR